MFGKRILKVLLLSTYLLSYSLLKGQTSSNMFEGYINYTSDVNLESIIPSKWGINTDSLNRVVLDSINSESFSTLYVKGNLVRFKLTNQESYITNQKNQFHCYDTVCDFATQLSNRDFKISEDTSLYIIRGIKCKKVVVSHPLQTDVYYYSNSYFKIDTSNFYDYKIGDPLFQFIYKTGHLPIKMEIGGLYTCLLVNYQEKKIDSSEFKMPDKFINALIESQTKVKQANKNFKKGQEKLFLTAFFKASASFHNLSPFISKEDIDKKNHLLLLDIIRENEILSITNISPNKYLVKFIENKINTKSYLFTITDTNGYLSLKLFVMHFDAPKTDIYLGNEMTVAFFGENKSN